MHPRYPKKRQGGFCDPPEWLVVTAVLAILLAVVLPLASKYGLRILKPAIVILGGMVAVEIWFRHRKMIIDWLRGRRRRGKKDT